MHSFSAAKTYVAFTDPVLPAHKDKLARLTVAKEHTMTNKGIITKKNNRGTENRKHDI